MKKLLNILAVATAAFAMSACTTDLDDVRVNADNVVVPVLSLPSNIDLGSAGNSVEFDYTPIDYGFKAAVNSTLHILPEGKDEIALSVSDVEGKLSVERFKLNAALIAANVAPAQAAKAQVWLSSGMINEKGALIESTVFNSDKVECNIIPYVWSVRGVFSEDGAESTIDMVEKKANSWLLEKVSVYGTFRFVYNHKDTGSLGGAITAMKDDFEVSTAGADIDLTAVEEFEAGTPYNITLNTATNVASVSIPDICWSLIGVNGDWNKDVDMEELVTNNGKVWISPVTTMEGNFKLRYAASWDENRGGAMTGLGHLFAGEADGANIELPEKADYQVYYYEAIDKIVVIKCDDAGWSLIGGTVMNDADGWSKDFCMTQEGGKWFADNVYISGSFKIREAFDWGNNRGGNYKDLDVPFEVEADGPNINLYKNFYNVVYDPANEQVTVSKGESYVDGGIEYPTEIHLTGAFSGYMWNHGAAPAYEMDKYSGVSGVNYIQMSGNGIEFKITHGDGPTWVSGKLASEENGVYTFDLNVGDNMSLPEGTYAFTVNMAENMAVFTKLEKVGLVGSATTGGWNDDTLMTLDPADNLYKWSGTLSTGEVKVRFNAGWDYNLGGDPANLVHSSSDNIPVSAGIYNVSLDIVHTPYTLNLEKTGDVEESYPEEFGLTGAFSGYSWDPAAAPKYAMDKITGASGVNYVQMLLNEGSTEVKFKFTHGSGTWIGGTLASEADGVYTFTLGGDADMSLPAGFYTFNVNLAENKAEFIKLEKVTLIGSATAGGWETDTPMTLDTATGIYKWSGSLVAGFMKPRFDSDKYEWKYNLGGDAANLIHGGGDIKVEEAGDYDVELDVVHTPNTLTVKKK